MQDLEALSRRALLMWNSETSDIASEIFAPDYINHQQPLAAGGHGTLDLAEWEAVVAANHHAYPNLRVEILMQIAEGDRVVTYWRFDGMQQGSYEGLAPTGKRVTWTGVSIDAFKNGRIVETWVVWDKYTQFRTLGLIG